MSTLTKMTRTVKKLEIPRPLKSTTSSAHNRNSVLDVKINSVDDLIVLTEAVAYQMMQGNYDRALQSNVSTMYSNLKLYGGQLESLYKEFLDRYFVVFRNGSQDERLDKKTRLHLLELIELRAKHWQGSDYMSQYYRHRGTHAEPLLVPTMDGSGSGGSVSPTLATPAEPPTMLGPGEVIKPSGKFPKPTKIPGKNYSKDEVVIRNADSGKVMGIKGRRVHMIEELSDTIISFQRVSPGAKERLVQITGPNEENVNHAKHLIGDTIRRNASPVRLEGALEGGTLATSRASLDSNGSDEARPREKSPHVSRALMHSFSTNDAVLSEYKYTVMFGQHSIKITGTNLDLVKTAKLVLDEYFESAGALEALGAGSGDFFTLSQRPGAALLLRDDTALNGADDDVFAPPDATPTTPATPAAPATPATPATPGLPPICRHLKKGIVPSIFPWTPKPSTSAIERQNRYMERSAKKELFPPQNPIETLTGNYSMEDRNEVSDKGENLPDVQMEIEIKTHEKGNMVSNELERSIRLVNSFTQTPFLNSLFSNYQLMTDDETILYYTGLESYEKFKTVLSTLLPMAYSICYRRNHVMNMSIEDQFLLMLMKLRRNLDDFILSKHFDISKSEVGNVFVTWINFVHQLWSKLNIWPSRELIDYFMPSQFKKKHKITRVIIDGTEVPITRPKNPKSQQATFSSYKHHNTIKFLVGSTPGGLLSYCSEGYGGSTSDRQIIERCNLIHKCNPGDGIMADRGFNIQDLLAPSDLTLLVPNFLKGLSQLPGIKLKHDQKLAANRIHIERLIGLIKTYKIFKTDVNAYYVPLMSKIFFVCLMLCNFREKIVN